MSRWAKVSLGGFGVVVVLVAALAGVATMFTRHYEGKVARDDVLAQADALPKITAPPEYVIVNGPFGAPSAAPSGLPSAFSGFGQNLLVLGVDTRAGWTQGESRSDTIMLVHLNADHTHADVVSFPRDSYVYIPPVAGKWAGGKTKINAAYAWGGAPLVVQVISHLTGLTIDHVIRVDFAAIRKITDIVGGVDVKVAKPVTDGRTGYHFPAGVNHLDGEQAEIYVRQRYGLPDGDFDRVKRQQQYLHALATKVVSLGVLANPMTLNSLLAEVAKSLVVDQDLDLNGLVQELSGMQPSDVDFTTIPSSGFVRSPAGVANKLDKPGCEALFAALSSDSMPLYFETHKAYSAAVGA